MININTLPAVVLWKNERVNFNNMGSLLVEPTTVRISWIEEPLCVKTQIISTADIDEKDIAFAPCKDDKNRMCDFHMSNEISRNGFMSMYCCMMCEQRKFLFDWFDRVDTIESAKNLKDEVLTSDMFLSEIEIKNMYNKIDKKIEEMSK